MARCTLVVSGAPLARRCTDIVNSLQTAGFTVDLVITPSAEQWVDLEKITADTGALTRDSQRTPGQPRLPLPNIACVCPATFNTINKAALGIADTHAHSFLNECIGSGIPLVFVPMINENLWKHPALSGHIDLLTQAGATFLSVQEAGRGVAAVPSGTGDFVVDAFDPGRLVEALVSAYAY